MIKRAPLATDPKGKCSRWHIKIYNRETKKNEWITHHGTYGEAVKLERDRKDAQDKGVYVSVAKQMTLEQVRKDWITHLEAQNRRTSTIVCYESALDCHVMPKFGTRKVLSLKKHEVTKHFGEMRKAGHTVATVNRAIRAFKALLNFAADQELTEGRNVMARYKPLERVKGERCAKRGSFTEDEVQRIFAVASVSERAMVALLSLSGPRPGEVYALDCECVILPPAPPPGELPKQGGYIKIVRTWDHRGQKFWPPKTKAGERNIPLSPWQTEIVRAQYNKVGGKGLLFPSGKGNMHDPTTPPVCDQALELYEQGLDRNEIAKRFNYTNPILITQLICHARKQRERRIAEAAQAETDPTISSQRPLNPSNFRRWVWQPLKRRAGVRDLDLMSFRHTFATLARASGAAAFNVSRMLGQARSIIVDTVYAETLPSGLDSVADLVTKRALGPQPALAATIGAAGPAAPAADLPVDEPLDRDGEPDQQAITAVERMLKKFGGGRR